MAEEKKTWFGLLWYAIKYVISMIFQKKDNEEFENLQDEIQNQYDQIDENLAEQNEQVDNSDVQSITDQLNDKF